jgi:hypothetical protein
LWFDIDLSMSVQMDGRHFRSSLSTVNSSQSS